MPDSDLKGSEGLQEEDKGFLELFLKCYFNGNKGPSLPLPQDLSRPSLEKEADKGDEDSRPVRMAMLKVRNAEDEAKLLAGQEEQDVPADGDCLFWAVMLSALISAKDTKDFQKVVLGLFGESEAEVVLGLFGKSEANENPNLLEDVLLPIYQGRVSDIKSYDTTRYFHALTGKFRKHVANYIRNNQALHSVIKGDSQQYANTMSRPREKWGGQIEIKAMAELLGIDIIVHQEFGLPMQRMPAKDGEKSEKVLHIAHKSGIHYHFYVPKEKAYWLKRDQLSGKTEMPATPSSIEFFIDDKPNGDPKSSGKTSSETSKTPEGQSVLEDKNAGTEERTEERGEMTLMMKRCFEGKAMLSLLKEGHSAQESDTAMPGQGFVPKHTSFSDSESESEEESEEDESEEDESEEDKRLQMAINMSLKNT